MKLLGLAGTEGIIANVQPHFYDRLGQHFDQFQTFVRAIEQEHHIILHFLNSLSKAHCSTYKKQDDHDRFYREQVAKKETEAKQHQRLHPIATEYAVQRKERYNRWLTVAFVLWFFVCGFCFVSFDIKEVVGGFAFILPLFLFLLSKLGWIPDAKVYKEAAYQRKYEQEK